VAASRDPEAALGWFQAAAAAGVPLAVAHAAAMVFDGDGCVSWAADVVATASVRASSTPGDAAVDRTAVDVEDDSAASAAAASAMELLGTPAADLPLGRRLLARLALLPGASRDQSPSYYLAPSNSNTDHEVR
jgi:hypothetical protein